MKRFAYGLWVAVAGWMLLPACASDHTQSVGPDSETHFLRGCKKSSQCGAPSCICGLCTLTCDSQNACKSAGSSAQCMDNAEPSCETPKVCDVECSTASDCARLGSGYACQNGRCRAPAVSSAVASEGGKDGQIAMAGAGGFNGAILHGDGGNNAGTGGVSGVDGGGKFGTGGNSSPNACSSVINWGNYSTQGLIELGPHNHVFWSPQVDTEPVHNYANQLVFQLRTASVVANFSNASGATIAPAPAAGVGLDPWLAELSLVLPVLPDCPNATGLPRSVQVTALWTPDIAIGSVPAHGFYLGSYRNGVPVVYADAVMQYDEGSDAGMGVRSLNTLAPVELSHTFTQEESNDEGVFLRVYLMSRDGDTPTTVHVATITWTQ
jgi:hypothetical protein